MHTTLSSNCLIPKKDVVKGQKLTALELLRGGVHQQPVLEASSELTLKEYPRTGKQPWLTDWTGLRYMAGDSYACLKCSLVTTGRVCFSNLSGKINYAGNILEYTFPLNNEVPKNKDEQGANTNRNCHPSAPSPQIEVQDSVFHEKAIPSDYSTCKIHLCIASGPHMQSDGYSQELIIYI